MLLKLQEIKSLTEDLKILLQKLKAIVSKWPLRPS